MQQKNFLHENPEWYEKVLPEPEGKSLSRFTEDLIEHYSDGKRVLDVGCGLGREVGHLRANGYEADGLDASPEMVAEARRRCPEARIELGEMAGFDMQRKYDTVLCFGSTFLYNHSNEDIMRTLATFGEHLVPGGILAMEMRNAAYFLTGQGQETLGRENRSSVPTADGSMECASRFDIDTACQILSRNYTWSLPGGEVHSETLKHRLIFPQEMKAYLSVSGYEALLVFDSPVPAAGEEIDIDSGVGQELCGYRIHVIAKKL